MVLCCWVVVWNYTVVLTFLRTTGYRGFEYTLANNLGGFMVFSGSIGGPSAPENLITSSEDYDGVGLKGS